MHRLYAEDLTHLRCSNPTCCDSHTGEPLIMHSRCHPTVATLAIFQPGTDHLHIVCAQCETLIVVIAVASRADSLLRRN